MNIKKIAVNDWVTSQNKVGKIVSEGEKGEFWVLWSGDSLPMNSSAKSLQIADYDGFDLAGKTFKDGRCNRLFYVGAQGLAPVHGVKAEVYLEHKKKPQIWSLEKLTNKLKEENPPFDQPTTLSLSQIRRDGGTQSRATIDPTTVDEYAEDYKNGANFPPITVFYDGSFYWLVDGFHREKAALKAGLKEIAAIVKQGTRRDAVLYSVGVNATHGLRRSNADKRRAVMRLLEDKEWSGWSDRHIAKKCGVSNRFVSNLRKSICEQYTDTNLNNSDQSICEQYTDTNLNNKRKVERGGKTYIQDTTNIGKGKQTESLPTSVEGETSIPNSTQLEEDKEVTSPSSKENNQPSNAPAENAPINIREIFSVGDRVRIKEGHYFGGQSGIITSFPNRDSVIVEFSPGKRELINRKDLNLSPQPQPKPPKKKEIIIQEGLNYKAGCPGYGCKWYVEVSEENYKRLKEYREKVGTITLDAAIGRFLSSSEEKEKIPNSDDLVIYFLSNVQQLPRERVNLVLEAFAKAHYDAFVQVYEVIEQKEGRSNVSSILD